ncbi:MAG: hypothetical protein ACI9WS_002420 [Paraglaciecola psychrophila]|jgi:hypothetical protein
MKINFLCINHRTFFTTQPEEAFQSCVRTCDTGWTLYQQGRWQEALPYVGTAFETAELLLNNRVMAPRIAMDWFLHAQAGLIQVLKKLGHLEACEGIYRGTIDRLKQEQTSNPEMNATIAQQIMRLNAERCEVRSDGEPDVWRVQPLGNSQSAIVLH